MKSLVCKSQFVAFLDSPAYWAVLSILCILGYRLSTDLYMQYRIITRGHHLEDHPHPHTILLRLKDKYCQLGEKRLVSAEKLEYVIHVEYSLHRAEHKRLENNILRKTSLIGSVNESDHLTEEYKNGNPAVLFSLINRIKHFFISFPNHVSSEGSTSRSAENSNRRLLTNIISDTQNTYRHLKAALHNVSALFDCWRRKESNKLSELIQDSFHQIQNPKNCSRAKRLICDLNRGCGLGCQINYGFLCAAASFALNRSLIIQLDGWSYSKKRWEDYFIPPSGSCQWTKSVPGAIPVYRQELKQIEVPVLTYPYDLYAPVKSLPFAIPNQISENLSLVHSKPRMWWVGQLVNQLWNIQPEYLDRFEKRMKLMRWKSPIVGIHVRRTDKIVGEARAYRLEEYMELVKQYYDELELKEGQVDQRRVFIASDDPGVFPEFRVKYPEYTLLASQAGSSSAYHQSTRYSDDSLIGIIADIHYLSQTDHLVCTMTSNVCRVAYSVLQTRFPDAGNRFDSLDTDYILFGGNPHYHAVRRSHIARSPDEISLNATKIIQIYTNLWNGTSQITKLEGQKINKVFPSYKLEDQLETFD